VHGLLACRLGGELTIVPPLGSKGSHPRPWFLIGLFSTHGVGGVVRNVGRRVLNGGYPVPESSIAISISDLSFSLLYAHCRSVLSVQGAPVDVCCTTRGHMTALGPCNLCSRVPSIAASSGRGIPRDARAACQDLSPIHEGPLRCRETVDSEVYHPDPLGRSIQHGNAFRCLCGNPPGSARRMFKLGFFYKRPGAAYVKNYDFSYRLPPSPAFHDFTVTSVVGHLISTDFLQEYKKWQNCDPFTLFDAPIAQYVETVSELPLAFDIIPPVPFRGERSMFR
jgi:hypothetical protein